MNSQHSAFATLGGKVIATGENGYKGRKFSKSHCTTHAEVNCIQNIKSLKLRKRKSVKVWSVLEGNKNSRPCINCCMSLMDFGIKKIIYFNGETWIEEGVEETIKCAKFSSGDRE